MLTVTLDVLAWASGPILLLLLWLTGLYVAPLLERSKDGVLLLLMFTVGFWSAILSLWLMHILGVGRRSGAVVGATLGALLILLAQITIGQLFRSPHGDQFADMSVALMMTLIGLIVVFVTTAVAISRAKRANGLRNLQLVAFPLVLLALAMIVSGNIPDRVKNVSRAVNVSVIKKKLLSAAERGSQKSHWGVVHILITADADSLYVLTGERVISLDVKSLRQRWSSTLPISRSGFKGLRLVSRDKLEVKTSDLGFPSFDQYLVNIADGKIDAVPNDGLDIDRSPSPPTRRFSVYGHDIVAFDTPGGRPVARYTADGRILQAIESGGGALFSTAQGSIYRLDAE